MKNVWLMVGGLCGLVALGRADADSGRGKGLYEMRCRTCHTAAMHSRTPSKVANFEQLKKEVQRWESIGKERWTPEELADVTQFLNDRFYHFDCPKAC